MDNTRITQILQEIINAESNKLSQLNGYLQEAISNTSTWYSTEEYQSLQNELSELGSRNSELESQIRTLRMEYENLIQHLKDEDNDDIKTNAELEALRMLSDSIRSDRDHLQVTMGSKDLYIEELKAQISDSKTALESTKGSVVELQNQIVELNNKVSGLLSELKDKQNQIVILSDTTDEVKAALEIAKGKIKSEMEEAMSEIDEALDGISSESSGSENTGSGTDTESTGSGKNGPYSDGYFKDGVLDTNYTKRTPQKATDDGKWYSYESGVAEQAHYYAHSADYSNGAFWNGELNTSGNNPTPTQAWDDNKWYTYESGSAILANGTYENGTYENGVLI
jgi:predicted  nucleic acid-binding Zn-ribbon protein